MYRSPLSRLYSLYYVFVKFPRMKRCHAFSHSEIRKHWTTRQIKIVNEQSDTSNSDGMRTIKEKWWTSFKAKSPNFHSRQKNGLFSTRARTKIQVNKIPLNRQMKRASEIMFIIFLVRFFLIVGRNVAFFFSSLVEFFLTSVSINAVCILLQ